MKIFHYLPDKKDVSGGIKVHYQLSQLEREIGYDSYIVFDNINTLPKWFKYNVKHISYSDMHKIANKYTDVIIGYENIEPLLRSGFRNKVSFIQGEVFVNRQNPYKGITIWFSNNYNKVSLPHLHNNDWFIVSPFIDDNVFYCPNDNFIDRKHIFSIQKRKDGVGAVNKIKSVLDSSFSQQFKDAINSINIIEDCNEDEFAKQLQNTKIFITHSYPEGLGLPGLEAMACGCFVVGFTGGGGSVYMEHGINSYVSYKDGDYSSLARMLELAYNMVTDFCKDTENIIVSGINTAKRFSKENTKNQLISALSFFER